MRLNRGGATGAGATQRVSNFYEVETLFIPVVFLCAVVSLWLVGDCFPEVSGQASFLLAMTFSFSRNAMFFLCRYVVVVPLCSFEP